MIGSRQSLPLLRLREGVAAPGSRDRGIAGSRGCAVGAAHGSQVSSLTLGRALVMQAPWFFAVLRVLHKI